jgi:hypothetical protein
VNGRPSFMATANGSFVFFLARPEQGGVRLEAG